MSDLCRDPSHRGHSRYVGGVMDGAISHLIYANLSDYPMTRATILSDGQRSWYEIDYEASEDTEAVYRFVGLGDTWEDAVDR